MEMSSSRWCLMQPLEHEWPDHCSQVTFDMQDESYGDSTADAEIFDLVWNYRGGDGHVLVAQRKVQYGWEEPWPVWLCECDTIDVLDHKVVMLARHTAKAPDLSAGENAAGASTSNPPQEGAT
jgi:hypothetical protein